VATVLPQWEQRMNPPFAHSRRQDSPNFKRKLVAGPCLEYLLHPLLSQGLVMPVVVRIDKQQGLVFRKATGTISVEELLASFLSVLQHPDYRSGMSSLNDLREVTVSSYSPQVKKIAEFLKNHSEQTGAARAALVVSSDAMFGMGRALQGFASRSPMEIEIFRDMGEARKWLGLEPEEDGSVQM